jgi:hypothetical protein
MGRYFLLEGLHRLAVMTVLKRRDALIQSLLRVQSGRNKGE